jgi:MFS transporter, OFA family, oxalate/formate antiporter
MSETAVKNKGWMVTFAGIGINLALGILYTWSIFKGAIKDSIEKGGDGAFNWDKASLNDPYAVCCLMFAFSMILAGRCQDKLGPRITALMGGLLVGIGFAWISSTTSYPAWVLGFGVLAGTGIGFGYSSATPPALKWFPPAKTGLIAGLVVSGFGLASLYIAPLSKYLVGVWGLQKAMLFFGLAFLVVVCGLSLLLVNPPKGYAPQQNPAPGKDAKAKPAAGLHDKSASEMMKTVTFWKLWFIYFIGAGAGLMVISSVGEMAKKSLGDAAFVAVAIMAVGNAAGRIIAGVLSDRIGRHTTLIIMLLFQSLLMFACIGIMGSNNAVILVLLATFIGFNYGTNLSLFPSITKDLWGLKNFGLNYGFVFTAWGVGGFVMSRIYQMLTPSTGTSSTPFILAGVLLIVGAAITVTLKRAESNQAAVRIKQAA